MFCHLLEHNELTSYKELLFLNIIIESSGQMTKHETTLSVDGQKENKNVKSSGCLSVFMMSPPSGRRSGPGALPSS